MLRSPRAAGDGGRPTLGRDQRRKRYANAILILAVIWAAALATIGPTSS